MTAYPYRLIYRPTIVWGVLALLAVLVPIGFNQTIVWAWAILLWLGALNP